MDHLKAAGKYNYGEWHYEKPKLRTQTHPSAHTDTYQNPRRATCNPNVTSMQKNGDRHNIRWVKELNYEYCQVVFNADGYGLMF